MYIRNDVEPERVQELHELAELLWLEGADSQDEYEWEMEIVPLGGQEHLEAMAWGAHNIHRWALSKVADKVADAITPY